MRYWRTLSAYACVLALSASLAEAQSLRISPEFPADVRIAPGETVVLWVFLDPLVPVDPGLLAYQTTLSVSGGTQGSLFIPPPTPPATNTTLIDENRGDYVFRSAIDAGLETRIATNDELLRALATIFILGNTVPVFQPKYLATYTFQASLDATGDFQIDFRNVNIPGTTGTFLQQSVFDSLPIQSATGVTIHITPPTDDCVNAQPIGDGATPFDTTNALTDGPSHPGTDCDILANDTIFHDVWFQYTATCSGGVTVSTCNLATFDTKIAAYDGCACPATPSNFITCGDNTIGCTDGGTDVTFGATAGNCYLIRVGSSLAGFTGTGEVQIVCTANDECPAAEPVTLGVPRQGSTLSALVDATAPTCGRAGFDSPGVWYSVIGTGKRMTASLCAGASYDTRLHVYEGGCAALLCIGGADNTCGANEELSWCSVGGVTYFMLVHGAGGARGTFTLSVTDDACNDGNECTSNRCLAGACDNPITTQAGQCCAPATGFDTEIDDFSPCTTDACQADGSVTHTPLPNELNALCDDGLTCTLDACEDGVCAFTNVNTIACVDDTNCPGDATCDATDFCFCTMAVDLLPEPGSLPVDSCYAVGDILTVNVRIRDADVDIISGQVFMTYDPATLLFIDVVAGPPPFGVPVFSHDDPLAGTIGYGGSIPVGQPGTNEVSIFAVMRFQVIAGCNPFLQFDLSGQQTLFTSGLDVVFPILHDMTPITSDPTPPAVSGCPADFLGLRPDLGVRDAVVTWPTPTAVDTCDAGSLPVTCSPPSGSTFPPGTTTVTCSSTNSCGLTGSCTFDVEVVPPTMTMDLELSPSMDAAPQTRCITFEIWDCDGGVNQVFEETLAFQAGLALGGATLWQANGVAIDLPEGGWDCVTARETLHTLRSTAVDLVTLDGGLTYTVSFVGDWDVGGHWLFGGNLNGLFNDYVDILDYGIVLTEMFAGRNRALPCGSPDVVHADINGDGVVDALDMSFVTNAMSRSHQPNCCGIGESTGGPIMTISLDELDELGLSDLKRADLNGDGVLDESDVQAYRDGARPKPIEDATDSRSQPGSPKRPRSTRAGVLSHN